MCNTSHYIISLNIITIKISSPVEGMYDMLLTIPYLRTSTLST
nr:MAG TPA: hypothetical protein [Crassvirales sp.]